MAYAFDPDALDPDLQLLRNFDNAWGTDLPLIRQFTEEEKQAEVDRVLAARIAGVISNDDRERAMLLDDFHDDVDGICAACMESVPKDDPHTPCDHTYCVKCLKKLFKASMQDESLMPPCCCRQEIPIALAKLTSKETEDFDAKRLEYSIKDRLYCSQPTYSTFIPPACIINSVGTCPKFGCGVTTCSICKAASHGNLDCPKDEATAAVLVAAREAGWTRSCRCRAIVELAHGCYHMTCRCRAEFCYLCSISWKNCKCVH